MAFGDLCCEAFTKATNFASSILQGVEDAGFAPILKQYSVAGFSQDAGIVQNLTESVEDAIATISNYKYKGGGTNTEAAIVRCQKELDGQPNPIIVLISDGIPTNCLDGDGEPTGQGNKKNKCEGEKTAQAAAEIAANKAANLDISIIPVSVLDDANALNALNALARCAGEPEAPGVGCSTNQGISVNNFDDLNEIINKLVVTVNCNGDERTLETNIKHGTFIQTESTSKWAAITLQ